MSHTIHFLGEVVQADYVKNPVSLSKIIFSPLNFFMHILTCLTYIYKVLKRSNGSSKRSLILQSMHYQPLFTRWICRNMAKLKTLSVCQKIFFSIKLIHEYFQYVCNISTKC